MVTSARILLLCGLLLAALGPAPSGAQEPVVHGVLFYSPTCPHCRKVIQVDLPPLADRYGRQLAILGVDVSSPDGQDLYRAVIEHFQLPTNRIGVPTLVVGREVLVGSLEIPQQLPGIIETGLAGDGVPWPAVGAIQEVLVAQGLLDEAPPESVQAPDTAVGPETGEEVAAADTALPERAGGAESGVNAAPPPTDSMATAAASSPAGAEASGPPAPDRSPGEADVLDDRDVTGEPTGVEAPPPGNEGGADGPEAIGELLQPGVPIHPEAVTMTQRFATDPVGNGVAVVVLLGMIGVLAMSLLAASGTGVSFPRLPSALVPALCAAGIGVAAYLAYVEMTGTPAVCGPVGDCNTVQQSEYARLFGVLPVGLLGVLGYLTVVAAWMAAVAGPPSLRAKGWLAVWGLAVVGTVFSAWLTFLEPFVIGATCAWCVTSSLIMTGLLVVATPRLGATERIQADPRGAPA
ncbi:MAG: vitamin K epoxide reductase family protein [Gemmatimonadota bacterium]